MVSLERQGQDITLRVMGSHRIWALKSAVQLKRSQITAVAAAESGLRPPWCKCPGTAIPAVICAGTYYGRGRKEFWDWTRGGKAIRIDLAGGPYTRVVVDVADPGAAIRLLTAD